MPPPSGPVELLRSTPGAARPAVLGVVAGVLAAALQLVWLVVLARVIARAFISGAAPVELRGDLEALTVLAVLGAACTWARDPLLERSAARLRLGLRGRMARCWFAEPGRARTDPLREEGGQRRGSREPTPVTALVEGVDDVAAWVRGFLPGVVSAAVVPLLVAAAVLALDPPSVLVLGFAGPMLVLLLAVIGRRSAAATRRREAELGWLGSLYLDLLAGLGTLRGFGREHDAAEVIEESSRRFGDTTMEVLRTAFQTSLVMEWAATAATALVAVQAGFRLVGGTLDFATALAVLVLTPEFFLPLRRLALEYHTGQSAEAASRRIRATLGPSGDGHGAAPAQPAGLDLRETAPRPAPRAGVAVDLQDVWLTRDGGRRAVLRGASMPIGAGEVVALTGESGVGKSSIAGLLLGFWSPDDGRILVDGVDLGELDLTHWRRRVAWVPQSPTVFAGTIAHNIALGEPDASPRRIRRAAERAGLHEVIGALPDGYDTVLGEGGGTLSGGERQRLAIARAVLRDAPLVVFDEFTAHLDPRTEHEVLESARCLLQGRSALVIAHRPATIAMADRVVRVVDGRIAPGAAPCQAGTPTDVAS